MLEGKKIATRDAKPGMILAEPVFTPRGELMLPAGMELSTEEQIACLVSANVTAITVLSSSDMFEEEPAVQERPEASAAGQSVDSGQVVQRSSLSEIGQARAFLRQSVMGLRGVLSGIRSKKLPAWDELERFAGDFVDFAGGNPFLIAGLLPEPRLSEEAMFIHSVNVAAVCSSLAREMAMPAKRASWLCAAALVHDVGVLSLLESMKSDEGPLLPDELVRYKRHPTASRDIVMRIKDIPGEVVVAVSQHHERRDGSGYPRGESGDRLGQLPLMLALADTYCSMLSGLPNNTPMPGHSAVSRIFLTGPGLFGTEYTEKLVHLTGVYPVGTIVRLSNEELAGVLSVNKADLLNPEVAVIFTAERVFVPKPDRWTDLSNQAGENPLSIRAAAGLSEFGIDYVDWISGRSVPS